ncbi:hypothetical protein QUA86_25015, partial [Microcoleus sp. F6_B6]
QFFNRKSKILKKEHLSRASQFFNLKSKIAQSIDVRSIGLVPYESLRTDTGTSFGRTFNGPCSINCSQKIDR